jgi:hypothetical protein
MIKNTIIIILLLLLLITFYAYMCLSTNMMDFKKERMEHIIKKETEIKEKEIKLLSMAECNDNLHKYKNMIGRITTDLTKASDDMNLLSKYATQINSSINKDINNRNNPKQIISEKNIVSNPENPTITITDNKISPKKEEQEMEHFGVYENFAANIDELDLPIEDGFITALD